MTLTRTDPNLEPLRYIAKALGDLRKGVVFLGGSTVGLLITDPAAAGIRATIDVDGITAARLAQYHDLIPQLQERGFVVDIESGITCRWRHKNSGIVFDLMPVDVDVLVRAAIKQGIEGLRAHAHWDDMPGMLVDPGRAGVVEARLNAIRALPD